MRLWVTQDMLQVQIEDQGVGFDPDKLQATQLINGASLGLASMRERVLLLEGQLTLESAP